jgi:hypothetical protein
LTKKDVRVAVSSATRCGADGCQNRTTPTLNKMKADVLEQTAKF